MQSGGALSSWSTVDDPWSITLQLAAAVNCTNPAGPRLSATGIMRCLKHVPVDDMIRPVIQSPNYFSAFGPTVDYRSVLPVGLRRLMAKPTESLFSSTSLLIGFTKNEGLSFFNQSVIDNGIGEDAARRILRTFVHNVYSYHRQYIYDVLSHQYHEWDRAMDDSARRHMLGELLSDSQYVAPAIELAQFHAKVGSPTYLYVFDYSPHTGITNID